MIIAVIFSLDLCGIFNIDIENIEELRKKVVFKKHGVQRNKEYFFLFYFFVMDLC